MRRRDQGSGSDPDPKSTRRKRYGWQTPRWRDPALWVAIALTVALVALQVYFNARASWVDWAALGLRALITWVLISAVIRIRRGLPRGLVDGYQEAEAKARARESGQSTGESVARTGGRLAGRAVAAYKRSQRND